MTYLSIRVQTGIAAHMNATGAGFEQCWHQRATFCEAEDVGRKMDVEERKPTWRAGAPSSAGAAVR